MKPLTGATIVALAALWALSPVVFCHASPTSPDSLHACLVVDLEQDPPYAAGKRLADLDAGEPRTVRLFYFLPNDRPFRPEVVQRLKEEMSSIQAFYGEQMEAHGYGYTTFRLETDDQGDPVVHRVDGQHPNTHYIGDAWASVEEIREVFDLSQSIVSVVLDNSNNRIGYALGAARWTSKQSGVALVGGEFEWQVLAHELAHTFRMGHDFRDARYILSYGHSRNALSACSAGVLAVHPYFNPDVGVEWGEAPTVELLSGQGYPAGSESVPIRLRVGDPDGLQLVRLRVLARGRSGWELKTCRGLMGAEEAVVEIDYDGVIPSGNAFSGLSDAQVHPVSIGVVDQDGNRAYISFDLWEISRQHLATFQLAEDMHGLVFAPGGDTLVSGSGRGAELWDVTTGTGTTTSLSGGVAAVALSPDGATLAAGSGTQVELLDMAGGEVIATLPGHSQPIRSLSFSPDGGVLASGAQDGIRLWDVAAQTTTATLPMGATSVAFSPDGSTLVSGSGDGVRLWNVAAQAEVAAYGHDRGGWGPGVNSVAFSPDGTLVASGGDDSTVRLWDVARGENVAFLDHDSPVHSVAFSPDGILASGADLTVNLWDPWTNEKLVTLRGEGRGGTTVAFSPDGTTLAAVDGEIEVWDVSEWLGARPRSLGMVSGDDQQATDSEPLAPLVVEVRDQHGDPMPNVEVTFTVTRGGGQLGGRFTLQRVLSDPRGRAEAVLTPGPGTNTVEVSVEGLEVVTFRLVALEPTDLPVGDGDPRKWHLPDRATMRLGKGSIISGGDYPTIPVAFSADGRRLAVAGGIGTWLYDAATVRAIDLLPGAWISSAAFSPEGALATGSQDGTVVVWDVASGESTTLYRHEDAVRSVAFSPDGATLAIGSWNALKLLDVADGRELWSRASDASGSLAFSPDGTTLTLTGRNAVRLWDVASGDFVTTHSAPALDDGTEVLSVAQSPDGATLAIGSRSTLRLWDIDQGRERATLVGHTGRISSLAFSSDGARLASGSYDRTARVWDAATGGVAATFDLSAPVKAVAFSPDGRTLAAVSWDDILLWEIETGSAGRIPGYALGTLALSPDGGTVAVASLNSTRLVDVRTGRDAATFESIRAYGLAFSPDGSILAVGERGRVTLWDVARIRAISTLEGPEGDVRSVAFSPDGSVLAVGYWQNIQLWDVAEGESIALLAGHTGPITSVAFSPDGAILASGAWDETARLWEVGTGQEIATFDHTGYVVVVAFSADGATLASGSWNSRGEIRLWEVSSRKEIATLGGHREVYSLAFSPDGGTLAAGPRDGTVVLYDTETWRRALTLEGHTAGVHSLAFSRDGTTLASGSEDGTVLLWDLTPQPHTLRIVSGDDQEGEPGALLPGKLIVEVRDENGDPFAGAQVTFAVTGGGGTVSVVTDTTDARGQAATTLTLGLAPGPSTVEVTVGDLEPVIFTALTPSVPTTLSKVGGDAQQGASGSPLAEPFVVALLDEGGAPLAGATVTFVVTAGEGTLSVTRATTDAQGRAATLLTLGEELGTYTVVATVTGLEPVTFTVTARASSDFDDDGEVGLSDFFLFAEAFGGSDPRFDLDGDGSVDFTDFFLFAEHFGRPARAKLVAMARERIGLPDGPQLRQNAPNPFNSQTVISWFQLEPGVAHLEVFAVTGQRVAMLHQGPKRAGLHRLRWDGRDGRGRLLASGVYVYRLVTSEAVQTRKLTLLR